MNDDFTIDTSFEDAYFNDADTHSQEQIESNFFDGAIMGNEA